MCAEQRPRVSELVISRDPISVFPCVRPSSHLCQDTRRKPWFIHSRGTSISGRKKYGTTNFWHNQFPLEICLRRAMFFLYRVFPFLPLVWHENQICVEKSVSSHVEKFCGARTKLLPLLVPRSLDIMSISCEPLALFYFIKAMANINGRHILAVILLNSSSTKRAKRNDERIPPSIMGTRFIFIRKSFIRKYI